MVMTQKRFVRSRAIFLATLVVIASPVVPATFAQGLFVGSLGVPPQRVLPPPAGTSVTVTAREKTLEAFIDRAIAQAPGREVLVETFQNEPVPLGTWLREWSPGMVPGV
jgi:hypothetical protein